jgi:hypothetical protein
MKMSYPTRAYIKFNTVEPHNVDAVITLMRNGNGCDEIQLGHQILISQFNARGLIHIGDGPRIIPLEFKYLEFLKVQIKGQIERGLPVANIGMWGVEMRDEHGMTDIEIYIEYIHVEIDGTLSMSLEQVF